MKIFVIVMGLFASAGAIAAGVSRPQPAKLESYRDWTIGCDNGGRCEAMADARKCVRAGGCQPVDPA